MCTCACENDLIIEYDREYPRGGEKIKRRRRNDLRLGWEGEREASKSTDKTRPVSHPNHHHHQRQGYFQLICKNCDNLVKED